VCHGDRSRDETGITGLILAGIAIGLASEPKDCSVVQVPFRKVVQIFAMANQLIAQGDACEGDSAMPVGPQ
jgi:hypothetical protein